MTRVVGVLSNDGEKKVVMEICVERRGDRENTRVRAEREEAILVTIFDGVVEPLVRGNVT